MNRPPLAFSSLIIRSMPGFRNTGFSVPDLCPGINVLYGPNGVGKSTTARSILSLLWPKTAPDKSSLQGRFHADGEEWVIDLDAGLVRYQRQGAEAARPILPPEEARDRYHLALHSLIASTDATSDNASLAEAILRESVGGYDITGAARELGFTETPVRPRGRAEDVRRARAQYDDALNKQRELADQEARLADLKGDLEEMEEAGRREALLEKACNYHKALSCVRKAEQELLSFPEAVGKLAGTEIETLERLTATLAESRKAALEQLAAIRDARRRRDAACLPAQGVPEATLEALKTRLEKLKDLAQKAETQKEKALDADAKAQERGERIQPGITPEQLQRLDREGINALADLARKADRLRAETFACESLQSWWGQAVPPADMSALREAISLLQRWLSSPSGEIGISWRLAATLGGILAVAETLLLALFLDWLWLLLALPGAGLIVWAWLPRMASNRRADLQQDYARMGTMPPPQWTEEAVQIHLAGLRERLAEGEVKKEKADRWQVYRSRIESLQAEQKQFETQRQEVLERFGTAMEASNQEPAALYLVADELLRWREAKAEASAAWKLHEELLTQQNDLLKQINATLASFDLPGAADVAGAEAQINELERRHRIQAEAKRDLRQAREKLRETIFPRRREAKRDYAGLFTRLGLAPGDEASLRQFFEKREAYRAAEEAHDRAKWRLEMAKQELSGYPELMNAQPEKLEDDLSKAREQAANRDNILEEIHNIETRIGEAKKGADIERAYTQLLEAQQRLRNEREERCSQAVGWALAAYLAQETHDATRPRVFHRARELFVKITQGRYRLEFEEGNSPRFRAIDTTTGMSHTLEELSTGTRLQLLLAVRAAFVEEQELGYRLPLILDEALANSDEQRAHALIEAIIEMCREGRQVFYFTAQYDEVDKWSGLLQQHSDIPHKVVDMAALRNWSQLERLPRITTPLDLPRVPEPSNLTYEEYGEILGVPGFDPNVEDVGGTHLWHLLEDVDALYRLLQANITTWGQLRNLYEYGGRNLIGEETFRRAEAAANVLNKAAEYWQVGRGKPVDSAALKESNAISDIFFSKVADLARKLDGNPAQLLEALERGDISHFRRNHIERLRAYLIEQHYLDESKPLSREEIFTQALAVAADDMQAGLISAERVATLVAKLPP